MIITKQKRNAVATELLLNWLAAVWAGLAIAVVCVLVIFCSGCAVRHVGPGQTAPATKFEQVLAWNAAASQANDGFADNVVALQKAGMLGIPEAKAILVKQATIAQADARITQRIQSAATCAAAAAGMNATVQQLDVSGATCAQISGPSLTSDLNLILGTISDLNATGLLAVKDAAKKQALSDLLASVQALVAQIYNSLEGEGVIK